MKIGFIGVGNMGGPMCRNILKKGDHEVTVFDLNPDAVARCAASGVLMLLGLEVVSPHPPSSLAF